MYIHGDLPSMSIPDELRRYVPRTDLYDSYDLIHYHMPVEQPPSTASYIIFKKGNKTYAKNGTYGHIEYENIDSATVIQYAINQMNPRQSIVVLGDMNISKTITITKDIQYYHCGKATLTSEVPYLTIGSATSLVEKLLNIYVNWIAGQGKTTNCIGIKLINCARARFTINKISECKYGILISNEGGSSAYCNDNLFIFNIIENCERAIYYQDAGSIPNSPQMEGNTFIGNIFTCNYGIKIDTYTKSGYGTFIGTIDNSDVSGSYDFHNEGAENNGWIIIGKYIRRNNSLFNANDRIILGNEVIPRIELPIVLAKGAGARITGNSSTTYATLDAGGYYWHGDKINPDKIIEARAHIVYYVPANTGTVGVRIYNETDGQEVAKLETTGTGWQDQEIDITSTVKSWTETKVLRTQTRGDGTNAPEIDNVTIKIVYNPAG